MKRLLRRMLDESEFLSDYGVRAISKSHEANPYVFGCCGNEMGVGYQPAESNSGLFGGNSNWRGPIWMPVKYLLIESLQKFHKYYGRDFKIECPTGSENYFNIGEVANELARRLSDSRPVRYDNSGRQFSIADAQQVVPLAKVALEAHALADPQNRPTLGADVE